jgi:hypothetical protein
MVCLMMMMMAAVMMCTSILSVIATPEGWSAEPRTLGEPIGPFNMTVPHRRVAIILPFTSQSLPLLAQSLSLWSGPDFTPCVPSIDDLTDDERSQALNAHDALLPSGMESRYPPAMVDLCMYYHTILSSWHVNGTYIIMVLYDDCSIVLAYSGDEEHIGNDVQHLLQALQGNERYGGISPMMCFGKLEVLFTSTPFKWDNPYV